MPSASRLRQRFNGDATQLIPLIEESLAELLIELAINTFRLSAINANHELAGNVLFEISKIAKRIEPARSSQK